MALRHLAFALLVVAGAYFLGVTAMSDAWSGPDDATATPTPTPRYDPDGPYATGVDPTHDLDRTFERVERLRGLEANASVPVSTYRAADERVHDEPRDMPDEFAAVDGTGARLLLVRSNASVLPGAPLGYADPAGPGTVGVHVMAARDLPGGIDQRAVLAHEFVHVLQHEHGLNPLASSPETSTTDRLLARWAVYEGDAMVTQLAYQRRYDVAGVNVTRYRQLRERRPRAAWPSEFGRATYYYGTRYLRARNATGERRNALVRDPPSSTRLLLHPDATPANRTLRLPLTLANDSILSLDHDRFGELAVRRALLVNGLSRERAVAASTGWRDGYVGYYYGPADAETGAWRTRWANASEAREFLAAYRRTLRGLNATRSGVAWRVETATTPGTFYHLDRTNATVTVVAGPDRGAVGNVSAALPAANASAGV